MLRCTGLVLRLTSCFTIKWQLTRTHKHSRTLAMQVVECGAKGGLVSRALTCVWSSRSPSESSPALSPHLSSSRSARSSSTQLLDVGWPSDRRGSGSRSLGASPRPSTSSDVDSALAVPHAGQRDRNEQLDQALEMSQLNLHGKQSPLAGFFGILLISPSECHWFLQGLNK